MIKKLIIVILVSLLFFAGLASAQVVTKVVDTGPGLATVTRFPDGSIMVFDTGHWNHDTRVFNAFQEFIGDDDIDLLITSHSDSDHLAATDELFNEFRVHRVIRTGFERPDTGTWTDHNNAITAASQLGLTHDINLAETTLPHGTTYNFGAATVTYIAGFHEPPAAWGLDGSEFRNGNSIVVRVSYRDRSILFTGDAVGREEDSPSTARAIATERFLIDNATARPIASDVLIAPHHGSDDASSTEFIQAVGARWVIFSSGHNYEHPKAVTANRFLDLGYQPACLLRTDLGDNEGDSEWDFGTTPGNDPVGDDNIIIIIPETGAMTVAYEGQAPVPCTEVPMSAPTTPPAVVKKSRSGICHTPESRWYERTTHFEPYDSLEACVASGGRPL